MSTITKRYIIRSSTVFILCLFYYSCDKAVSISPSEPTFETGKLFINSEPQGASIFLGGKFTGNITPDTINWLEVGEYRLTLKLKLFSDYSTTINIKKDEITDYFLDYKSIPSFVGTLFVSSTPSGAEIFLNDSSTNLITPTQIDRLFPGTYNIKLRLSGYWDENSTIEVESNHNSYSNLSLTDSLVWVNFTTNNSNLPDHYINNIAIENGSIKWIATLSSGVVKFDDKTWTVYNENNSPIPTNVINYIIIDKSGNKWIATLAGLVKFDDINWTTFTSSNSGLPVDNISCIAAESNGSIWIGTQGGGLVFFDGINWNLYNTSNSVLRSNIITSISIDNQGNKWIGMASQGIAKYNGTNWVIYSSFEDNFSNNVSHVTIDQQGIVWASITQQANIIGGTAYYNGVLWQTYIGMPSSNLRYITVDKANNKWFGNADAGFTKYDGNNWTQFTTLNSELPNDRIFAIAIDGAGNKWIATYGGGIVKYKGQ